MKRLTKIALTSIAFPFVASGNQPAVETHGNNTDYISNHSSDHSETADTISLPEVTVTAIKHSPLFKEAVASTTVTGSTVEQMDILSIRDAADIIPNFYVPDYGSRITSSIYVRGLGARIDQPTVGLNVDNVPILNKDAFDLDIDNITSIEMLRGPQSTLYGRNTMAGLINVSTLSPFRWQGVKLMAEYGSGNTWHAGAGIYSKPLPTLGLSLNIGAGGTDGFFTNMATGKKCDNALDFSGRWKTEWRPSASLSVLNTFSASRVDQGGYPYEYVPTGEIAYADTCSYKRTFLTDGLTVQWQTQHFILSSITSWQYLNDDMRLDQDFLPDDYFTLRQKRRENSVTQDFVIKSTPSDSPYSWLTGLFGFYKGMDMDAPVTFLDYGITTLIEQHRNDANPYFPIRWIDRQFPLNSNFKYPTEGVALYHRSELSLGKFTLTAGLRLDYEHASLDYRSHCNTSYMLLELTEPETLAPLRTVPVDIDEHGHLSLSFLELLPKISVLYDLSGNSYQANVYASVSKGYKAGGFNTQMFSDVLQQRLMRMLGVGMSYDVEDIVSYKPEKSWNYEAGIHFADHDGKYSAEAALFYIDCSDQQLTVFPDGMTTGRIMTNAGKTRSYGAEISAHASPADPLSLTVGYGYTNAKFKEFNNGKESFAGKFVPYSPAHTLFVRGAYTFDLPVAFCKTLCIAADMKGTGKIYWDEANSLSQDFYILLGASATFAHPRYSLQIWGRNLTDTKYSTFYFMSINHQFLQRGLPATVGATLRINI